MASSRAPSAPLPLVPVEGFGLKGNLRDGVHFLDASTIAYVAGHCVILKDCRDKKQRVIAGTPSMYGISALAVSTSKKFIAVAEVAPPTKIPGTVEEENASKAAAAAAPAAATLTTAATAGAKSPMINIYTLQSLIKKRSLTTTRFGSREIVSMCFSADGRMLAAQGGAPNWKLLLWDVMATKVAASIRSVDGTVAYQVRYCPVDESLVTVVGDGFAKTFKYTDSSFRPVTTDVTNQEPHQVLCHVWLPPPSELVAKHKRNKSQDKGKEKGTSEHKDKDNEKDDNKNEKTTNEKADPLCCMYSLSSGELLYVEDGKVASTITQSSGSRVGVANIAMQCSIGFICGEDGYVSIYEYEGAKKNYRKVRSIKVDESRAQVCGLALSPAEDVLVCTMANNTLTYLPYQRLYFLSTDSVPKEVVAETYHQAEITGMDICLLKPFAVSCSKDMSVRVWNYVEHCCEIVKYFPSEALSISLHPTGLYVVVGFPESIKLFNLLVDDLQLWREFPIIKNCVICAFSTGGQYFAAVNGNNVHIFSTYNGLNIGTLRAHVNQVQSIWWAHDDFNIVTSGMDGAIYEWTVKTFKRKRENVIKGCIYTCVIGLKNSRCFYGVGSDRKLRELDEMQVLKIFESNVALTQIAMCGGGALLFAGTETGAIRAYSYPLTGMLLLFMESSSPICKLCVSSNETHLVCASEDGLTMVLNVRDFPTSPRDTSPGPWCHEALITKDDLEELKSHVEDLKTKMIEMQSNCEYQLRIKDERVEGQIQELQDQFALNLEDARVKHQELIMDKNETVLFLIFCSMSH
ncbi:unnamed protein product [Sphagnum jensenii]|uniref:Uncharacterized protein n=1 Tax=Sphagnum jensenii TaxID=128206 RepID=A0ABP0VXJ5_9BRYO